MFPFHETALGHPHSTDTIIWTKTFEEFEFGRSL